jgi:hypothetical protein
MIRLQNKIVRIGVWTISSLILVGVLSFTAIYFLAQNYLNKNLSELVEKKSKGKYEITYDNLKFSFKTRGIVINQVSYHPSDSIAAALKNNLADKQFFSFTSPQVKIEGIQLGLLFFRKKLVIGSLVIDQPELKIHGKQTESTNKKDNINELIQQLKPLVTKNFKSVFVGKIELQNASYDFYNLMGDTKKLSNAENISIGVLNFYTDSLLLPNPDRLFDATDIYIRMQKYQASLADSIHRISAESITYSLKRSVIEAKNIEVAPTNKKLVPKSKYYIFVPSARITTSNIKAFYRNNIIPVDSMVLATAEIKYWPAEKAKSGAMQPIDEFDLNDLIKNDISGITVKDFVLNGAKLQLYKAQNDTASQQELRNIRLKLNDFRLDSSTPTDTSRVFYSKRISFSASDYNLTLGDNIHHIKVGNLHLATDSRSVLVKDIEVFSQNDSRKYSVNNIEGKCDSVRLDNFDFKKAFHQKRFSFQRINLFNPEVEITQNVASSGNLQQDSSFVYNLISRYAKGVYANQVIVSRGTVHLINKTGVLQTGNIESAIRLQLSGFALDEQSVKRTDRLFYANQIELNFNNYEMQLTDQLHKMTVENLSISTRKKRATMQNLHLFPVSTANMEEVLKKYNRSELYEFTIPEMTLAQADFHNAFFNKKFTADSLLISSPKIYYENYAQLKELHQKQEFDDLFHLMADYLTDIQINTVDIPDGTLRLINHSKKDKTISFDNRFSLKLGNTRINEGSFGQKRLLFSDFVDFSVRDHLIRLSDNVHVLKASEIGFSTRQKEIYVLKAKLYPEPASKEFSSVLWNIQLSIPEVRIKGISIEDFFFDHKINAANLIITSPDIKLYQKHKPEKKTDLKEVSIPLPPEIGSIALQNFSLNDGALKVFSELESKPLLLVQSDLKMAAKNVLIEKNSSSFTPEFKKGDYNAALMQFRFTPKDKNQQFSIEELDFSTADKQLLAKNLNVKPKTKSNKQNQYELQIPLLSMNGFDLESAYKNNVFNFESIVVDKPDLQRFVNAKDSLKINPFKVSFYPYFESFADVFYSRVLKVNNANVSVYQSGQKKFQQSMSFNLEKVRIENKPSQGFMHSSNFSFTIPNLKEQGKLYHFEADKSVYSSADNRFTISGIRIIPNFSTQVHQQKVGFQSDYISGKIDSIQVVQPDARRWFDKEELAGKYAGIFGLNLDLYRDKKMPFDESRRPKMLQDLIKSIKVPIVLDSLSLIRSSVNYSERAATGEREGKIRFNDIRLCISPFTNMKSGSGRIPDFNLKGIATAQDSAFLKVEMNYQMNDPENSFSAKGSVAPFNMRIVNPVLEPLALITIRSGRVNQFDFDFSANRSSAEGQLYFGYDNLKIGVLELKEGSTKESHFASFLANSLLLKSRNPRGKDRELLPDPIAFKRDQRRSILNYWWKSVFSGVKNTLEIKDKQEEQPKQP